MTPAHNIFKRIIVLDIYFEINKQGSTTVTATKPHATQAAEFKAPKVRGVSFESEYNIVNMYKYKNSNGNKKQMEKKK